MTPGRLEYVQPYGIRSAKATGRNGRARDLKRAERDAAAALERGRARAAELRQRATELP